MGTPNGSGDIYIFAGLVKDQVKNDLYVLNVAPPPANPTSHPGLHHHLNQILTVGLVETRGEVPLPRVGHASVGVGNVLIVWGGDTKTRDDEKQDEGLYLLNLSTREWTRVKVSGPCPEGRYGHSAVIIGSKFYIFGGQTDNGRFMNDLWSFDLHKLKSGAPKWQRAEFPPSARVPSERTGHTVVTFKDAIYVFGGTDGQYHYNDTWKLDVSTGTWKELDCIGYIPLPREGHAATLVDDVMYVLGGRGVDGKDLDDLAAFKISNQRWYMFQNMGPAPAGRSGHSMASWQGKVYVLGGESYTSARPDDPSIVHVLDTGKIKYPPDPVSIPRQQAHISASHKSSDASLNDPNMNTFNPMSNRASNNNLPGPSESNSNTPELGTERHPKRSTTGPGSNPPPRPRRQDDPSLINSSLPNVIHRRTIGASTPQASPPQSQLASNTSDPSLRRSISPIVQHARTGSLENSLNLNSKSTRSSQSNATVRQNSSPVPRRISAEITRMLHFNSPSSSSKRPQDISSSFHTLTQSTSASPDRSSSVLSKQNGWMKAALAMAVKQGFTLPPSDEHDLLTDERSWLMNFQERDSTEDSTVIKDKGMQRLIEALVQLKGELTKAKIQMADQSKRLDNRLTASNKAKSAALQEASFYRVKLAAYEASSVSEVNKLDRQRINDLEQKLSDLVSSKSACERRLAQVTLEVEQERNLRELSEGNLSKSNDRSEQLEALHSKLMLDYEELLKKSRGMDLDSSDWTERYQSLQSTHHSVVAELESSKERLASSELANEKYLLSLEHLNQTIDATNSRIDQMKKSWDQAKVELESQRATNFDLGRELDLKLQELDSSKTKIQEMEETLRSLQDENLNLKALNDEGISQLIHATRSMAAVSPSHPAQRQLNGSDSEKVDEERDQQKPRSSESNSSKNLSRKKLESTVVELDEVRSRNRSLTQDLLSSKSETAALRVKITNLVSELHKLRSQFSSQEYELKEKTRLAEAAEVKASLLKNLIAENGLLGGSNDDEPGSRSFDSSGPGTFGTFAGALLSSSLGSNSLTGEAGGTDRLAKKVHDLELQLDERSRAQRELEKQFEETQKEIQLAEDKYREAHRKHEAAADEIASLVEEVQRLRSGGASSVSPASVEGHQGKVEEELQALQERHRTLEQTHVKAVQYVKGTEKMLRRMKDELSKYKERTELLESELTNLRRTDGSLDGNQLEGAGNARMTFEMKEKLTELTNQIEDLRTSSRESNLENEELQRKMDLIKVEYERDMKSFSERNRLEIERLNEELNQLNILNDRLKQDFGNLSMENSKLNEVIKNSKNSINRVIHSDDTPSHHTHSNGSGSGRGTPTGNHLDRKNEDEKPESILAAKTTKFVQNSQAQIDWLKKENLELQSRCQDAEAKISLLLDHMDNRSETNRRSTGLESIESDYSNFGNEILGAFNQRSAHHQTPSRGIVPNVQPPPTSSDRSSITSPSTIIPTNKNS